MKGERSHIPTQEDVAGGYAFILYAAWVKFGDESTCAPPENALTVLYNQKENRFYEAMMPVAAYVAARMNAEAGTDFDIQRFLDWTFDGTAVGREGWGVLADNWGGYDVSGLAGSTVHNGGYGFLMNTFDLMMPMSALLRYDQRYARAVGKWALNATNAARFCYPGNMPDSLQAIPQHKSVDKNVIAYEGISKRIRIRNSRASPRSRRAMARCGYRAIPRRACFRCMEAGTSGFSAAPSGRQTCRKYFRSTATPPIFTKKTQHTRPACFSILMTWRKRWKPTLAPKIQTCTMPCPAPSWGATSAGVSAFPCPPMRRGCSCSFPRGNNTP
ncbi:MAG: hypothetical protein IPK76_08435 [Lewinellaceae bacterium]|nr:hypothetical protein [Lewinellaceae bacterium]